MGVTVNATKDFTCDLCSATANGEASSTTAPSGWAAVDDKLDGSALFICDTCLGKSTDADKATVYDNLVAELSTG